MITNIFARLKLEIELGLSWIYFVHTFATLVNLFVVLPVAYLKNIKAVYIGLVII
jgi:hypothetical protein